MTLIDMEPLLAEGWILARTAPTRYGKTTQTMSLAGVEKANVVPALRLPENRQRRKGRSERAECGAAEGAGAAG